MLLYEAAQNAVFGVLTAGTAAVGFLSKSVGKLAVRVAKYLPEFAQQAIRWVWKIANKAAEGLRAIVKKLPPLWRGGKRAAKGLLRSFEGIFRNPNALDGKSGE